ncbi:universal stress protein [bacterium]|nr:universal stress protein [bacterium]
MKNILVPTDFSPEAENALKVAVDMAKTFDGKITLLNVVDAPGGNQFTAQGGSAGNNTLDDIFTIKLIEKMQRDLEEMVDEYPDAPITHEMALGFLHEKVNERVKLDNIDIIIMGTKGAEGLAEVMIGSNAEKVVRLAHCPVLTVKESAVTAHPNNIVFASDFTENSDKVAAKLIAFQKAYKSKVHLLFVNTPNRFEISSDSNRRMEEFAKKYGMENYTLNIYNHRDEEDGILSFAEEFNMDLIAVATHSRQGLAHLLSGSIAEGVVNHSNKPVLTFSLKHLK